MKSTITILNSKAILKYECKQYIKLYIYIYMYVESYERKEILLCAFQQRNTLILLLNQKFWWNVHFWEVAVWPDKCPPWLLYVLCYLEIKYFLSSWFLLIEIRKRIIPEAKNKLSYIIKKIDFLKKNLFRYIHWIIKEKKTI